MSGQIVLTGRRWCRRVHMHMLNNSSHQSFVVRSLDRPVERPARRAIPHGRAQGRGRAAAKMHDRSHGMGRERRGCSSGHAEAWQRRHGHRARPQTCVSASERRAIPCVHERGCVSVGSGMTDGPDVGRSGCGAVGGWYRPIPRRCRRLDHCMLHTCRTRAARAWSRGRCPRTRPW